MINKVLEKLSQSLPFKRGDTVEGEIVSRTKNRIWVDIDGKAYGQIPPRELSAEAADVKVGDKILCYVLEPEDDCGNMILSLRRADREKVWENLKEKFETGGSLKVRVVEANKGGLMVEAASLRGFLPVSQLSGDHYPKVEGGDKNKIQQKLAEFINQNLEVKIIGLEKKADKLIFSEKQVAGVKAPQNIEKFKVGDMVEATISAIVDFGIFVKFDSSDGLIHISEISWDKVTDLNKLFKLGDKVSAQIIGLENNRISLSIKRLSEDPWVKKVNIYKVNQIVEGEIIRVTPFGAFVKLDASVEGLVHVSELSEEKLVDPREVLKVGDVKKFKIISIEPAAHRLGLSLKKLSEKNAVSEKKTLADYKIDKVIINKLKKAKIDSISKIMNLKPKDLEEVGLTKKQIEKLIETIS
jgi:small subunit ribosomal protein S1